MGKCRLNFPAILCPPWKRLCFQSIINRRTCLQHGKGNSITFDRFDTQLNTYVIITCISCLSTSYDIGRSIGTRKSDPILEPLIAHVGTSLRHHGDPPRFAFDHRKSDGLFNNRNRCLKRNLQLIQPPHVKAIGKGLVFSVDPVKSVRTGIKFKCFLGPVDIPADAGYKDSIN